MSASSLDRKIFLYILLFFAFLPFLRIHASDVNVKSIVSPTDNKETATTLSHPGSEYKFIFTFDVPVINPIPQAPQDVDAIVFEGQADGGTKGYQYIWNQKRKDWQGKTVTAKWNVDISKITIPIGSKSFTWSLYDYYTKTKYVNNQTFSLKDDNNYKGWYFISKTKSQTVEEYIYAVSSKYTTEADCNAGWNLLLTSNPSATSYTNPTCKEYPTLPTTPENQKILPPNQQGSTNNNTDTNYTLLEPLPGLENFESNKECAFGRYLNIIIKLFLGICAVLAVIMIVYGGLEYMLSSTPASKEAKKTTITNAIFGLIIALGAYLLLYTINPRLLDVCLDQQIPNVELQLQEDEETIDTAQVETVTTPPSGKLIGCEEGTTGIQTKGGTIYVCKSIANRLKQMIDNAWSQGIKLSGGGFRSKSQQESLRAKNCGGNSNIYNKKAKCKPKTAYPGTSRHENGLAIDFRCSGSLIVEKSNSCFTWLKSNAGTYGLKNFKSEPWHWSIDGK